MTIAIMNCLIQRWRVLQVCDNLSISTETHQKLSIGMKYVDENFSSDNLKCDKKDTERTMKNDWTKLLQWIFSPIVTSNKV